MLLSIWLDPRPAGNFSRLFLHHFLFRNTFLVQITPMFCCILHKLIALRSIWTLAMKNMISFLIQIIFPPQTPVRFWVYGNLADLQSFSTLKYYSPVFTTWTLSHTSLATMQRFAMVLARWILSRSLFFSLFSLFILSSGSSCKYRDFCCRNKALQFSV